MQMDMDWNWPCGVAFYGISRLQVNGNKDYIDFLVDWVDEYLEIGLPKFMVNAVSMGHVLITMYDATKDEKYWKIALDKAEYLRSEAVRFADGVFSTLYLRKMIFRSRHGRILFYGGVFSLRVGKRLTGKII